MAWRRPFWLVASPALAALCLLLLFASPVVADHSYSHRYVVYGRVVDSLGEPVQGVQVAVSYGGGLASAIEGPCTLAPTTQSTTDGWGDWFWCNHVHGFSSGTVVVTIRGTPYNPPADPNLRKSVQNVQLPGPPEPSSSKDPTIVAKFDRTVTVRGRAWTAQGGATVEGIQVNGIALGGVGVHSALSSTAGNSEYHMITNNYGDYAYKFEMASPVTSGTVTLTYEAGTARVSVNTIFMIAYGDLIVPAQDPFRGVLPFWPYFAAIGAIAAIVFVVIRFRPRGHRRHAISVIPGVGRAKAAQLRSAGYSTVELLAAAKGKDIAEKTSLSEKEAKRLIKKAKELLEVERPEPVGEPD